MKDRRKIDEKEFAAEFKPTLKTKKCWSCGAILNVFRRNKQDYIAHPKSDCTVFRSSVMMARNDTLSHTKPVGFKRTEK